MQMVAGALRSVRSRIRSGADFIPASRLSGSELIHLGGGEMVPTPGVRELPLDPAYRSNGLGGESLALPPARVRILEGVHVVVGENVVRLPDGTVVGESVSSQQLRSLPRRHRASLAAMRSGRAAPYGDPGAGAFEGLVEALPRALLLQHPALRSFAPITLLCAPGAPVVERWLRDRLGGRQVRPEELAAGDVVQPQVTVVAGPVSRAGAGAIPRWYRRWIDAEAAAAGPAPGPRRLLLVHGGDDPASGRSDLVASAERWDLTTLDCATGHLIRDGARSEDVWSPSQVVAALRDATVLVGASDDALGHAIVSRRAEIVHVGVQGTVSPRVLQLAESRGLPYRFVRRGEMDTALEGA